MKCNHCDSIINSCARLDYNATSNRYIWYKCDRDHAYMMTVKNKRLHACECPYCDNNKQLIQASEFMAMLNEPFIDESLLINDTGTYCSSLCYINQTLKEKQHESPNLY